MYNFFCTLYKTSLTGLCYDIHRKVKEGDSDDEFVTYFADFLERGEKYETSDRVFNGGSTPAYLLCGDLRLRLYAVIRHI